MRRIVFTLAMLLALVLSMSEIARADDSSLAEILARLGKHAEQFEQMKRRGSFTLQGRLEELDRSGHVDGTKEIVLHSTATPTERVTDIVRYTEDGADKTADARSKAAKDRAQKSKKPKKELHLPFLESERRRYVFSLAEVDPHEAARVRVAFRPHEPAEDAFKGSAWVDTKTGEILTMGFSPSQNERFVDHVDITIRFDLATTLGRAPSSITFDARGGFLFLRKHYRGFATISDARVAF